MLSLRLALLIITLLLVVLDVILEHFVIIFKIKLQLFLLFLLEFMLTQPESLIFFEFSLNFSILPFDFVALDFPLLSFLSIACFSSQLRFSELFIFFLQFLDLIFKPIDELLLSCLKILMLLNLNGQFSFGLRLVLLHFSLEIFEFLSLLVILILNSNLLRLLSSNGVLKSFSSLFLIISDTVFILFHCLPLLLVVLINSLLLELNLLVLKSLLSFKVYLGLCNDIVSGIILLLKIFILFGQRSDLLGSFFFFLLQGMFSLKDLLFERLFLMLKLLDQSVRIGVLRIQLVKFFVQLTSFL